MSDDAARPTLPCPRCSAAFEPGQEYCLECGLRLPPTRTGDTGRAASFAEPRATATWLAPALVGLVLALLGTGAAIAISSNGETEAAVPTATGGSLTAPPSTPTLTAPEEARERGLRRVGILDSSRFASLHPGYYVVFQGVFESEADAASSLQRARSVFPAAYQRAIVP